MPRARRSIADQIQILDNSNTYNSKYFRNTCRVNTNNSNKNNSNTSNTL